VVYPSSNLNNAYKKDILWEDVATPYRTSESFYLKLKTYSDKHQKDDKYGFTKRQLRNLGLHSQSKGNQ
jgi:hypothetical protein